MERDRERPGGTFPSSGLARMTRDLALFTYLLGGTAVAQEAGSPDWPCQQVLVRSISVPAVWSGPPIAGVDWRKDPELAERVARLAARRLPIDEAQEAIENLAAAAGPGKTAKLVALFAGLFETLDHERTEVIDGLIRFGRKQRELAERIRAAQSALRSPAERRDTESDQASAMTRLEWDLRVFEERRRALASVCESPALIEQRLFALARTIEQHLE